MTRPPDPELVAELAEQARRDLEELEEQLAAGEIDPDTAESLRRRYLADLDAAQEAAADPPRRSSGRIVVAVLGVALAVGAAITLAGFMVQDPVDESLQGVAATPSATFDPSQYSNEALEAVIRSYENDPAVADQLVFMRFRLAERYFEAGDFRRAFPHYQAILESEPPADLAAVVLTRLAWVVWVGNGEVDLGLSLADRALEADPGNQEAIYVKAQLLWCGKNDPETAVPLLEELASDPNLDPATSERITEELRSARSGESC